LIRWERKKKKERREILGENELERDKKIYASGCVKKKNIAMLRRDDIMHQ